MSREEIPLTALQLSDEDVTAVMECYRSGWLTMGPRTEEFEAGSAQLVGAPHVVALSSGMAAMHLALVVAGVGPGDEVLMSALAFPQLVPTVLALGARPVAVDVLGPHDHAVDPEALAASVTAATRAVVASHPWGYPCEGAPLQALADDHGLVLIEDAAHAIGAEGVGGGALTCYSLSASKQLAVGEGGFVATHDAGLAADMRLRRSHAMTSGTWDRHRGGAESYDVTALGWNLRLDEPRAALGLSRLTHLADDLRRRRQLVERYRAALCDIPGIHVPFDEDQVRRGSHGAFGVLLDGPAARDAAAAALGGRRIASGTLEALPGPGGAPRPRAGEIADRALRLPLSSTMTHAQVDDVTEVLRQSAGSSRR